MKRASPVSASKPHIHNSCCHEQMLPLVRFDEDRQASDVQAMVLNDSRKDILSCLPEDDALVKAWKHRKNQRKVRACTWKDEASMSWDERLMSSATQALESELQRSSKGSSSSFETRSFGFLDSIEIEDTLAFELETKLSTANTAMCISTQDMVITPAAKRRRTDCVLRRIQGCSDLLEQKPSVQQKT